MVDSTEYDEENGDAGDSDAEEPREETQQESLSDVDSDEERRRLFLLSLVEAEPYINYHSMVCLCV